MWLFWIAGILFTAGLVEEDKLPWHVIFTWPSIVGKIASQHLKIMQRRK